VLPKGHIRKPVLELVERARQGIHLTNNQRVAIALEYIANGYDDNYIAKIFERQEDYGTGEKTRYHIRKLREGFERGDYKPYTTENLLKILEEVDKK
jgi:DNA primase large subunit